MTRKLLAEFIGTFAIVYCGVGAIALSSSGLINGGLLGIAFGHAFAVMGMIYALGGVSGAHFNPAVSLALASIGRFSWRELPFYVLVQLSGGVAAVGLLGLTHSSSLAKVAYGATVMAPGVSAVAGLTVEIVLTFFLTLVIVRVAVLERHPLSGLLIGLTVMMGICAAGPLTGVALNPARALGPALFSGNWTGHWIVWLGPVVGALLGAWTAIFLQVKPLEGEIQTSSVETKGV